MKFIKRYIDKKIVDILTNDDYLQRMLHKQIMEYVEGVVEAVNTTKYVTRHEWDVHTERKLYFNYEGTKVDHKKIAKFLDIFNTIVDKRAKYELEKINSVKAELDNVKAEIKQLIAEDTMDAVNTEIFLDKVVDRINRKQLHK